MTLVRQKIESCAPNEPWLMAELGITILDIKSTERVSGIFVQIESSTKNTACYGKVSQKVLTSATKAAKITILDTKITASRGKASHNGWVQGMCLIKREVFLQHDSVSPKNWVPCGQWTLINAGTWYMHSSFRSKTEGCSFSFRVSSNLSQKHNAQNAVSLKFDKVPDGVTQMSQRQNMVKKHFLTLQTTREHGKQ